MHLLFQVILHIMHTTALCEIFGHQHKGKASVMVLFRWSASSALYLALQFRRAIFGDKAEGSHEQQAKGTAEIAAYS
jgi:hypothetical protein